jgi:hypothetical protein
MALQKIIEDRKLYARIDYVFFGKTNDPRIVIDIFEIKDMSNNPNWDQQQENLFFEKINNLNFQIAIDSSEFQNWSVEKMNLEGENPYKIAYTYLKNNILLFADWEDC